MNITTAIYAYNTGSLEGFTTLQLNELAIILNQKIWMINEIVKTESVAPQVRDDLRKYNVIATEITKLIERRNEPITII